MSINKLATQEEAKALFDWAMVYLKINGRNIAYKAFNQVDGKFTDRDLYIFCLDYNKVWKVMGENPLLNHFSPWRVRINHPPVSSVAPMAEIGIRVCVLHE